MQLKGRGWALVSVLLTVLAVAPVRTPGQVALTSVQDTVYTAEGVPAQGTVVVSWAAFTTAAGSSVAAGTSSTTLGGGGALSLSLVPNSGSTPTGSYYTAVFHLSDGTTSRQYWVIPAAAGGAPVKLAAIESQVLPTSVAMQTVSKSYVDSAIASALSGAPADSGSGPYVLQSGSTMTGPLVLPGNPVSPLQAADKNYVDTNVAQIAGGLSSKVSTLPTSTQTVTQPTGSQLEVNILNGVLDATGYLSGNGNNGFANALSSVDCVGGCEVRAGQSYAGTENVPTASIPTGGHVTDTRGGSVKQYFTNPLGSGAATGLVGSSLTESTTMTAPQFQQKHAGGSLNAYAMGLTQSAMAGGNNLFPGSHEAVPYFKSNFGVLNLVGNYNTQGQHVQFGNTVNCFSVGDCMAGGQLITSMGGYRDEADEGTHPFDLQVGEDSRVFQGTCGTGCKTGSTSLVVNQTAGAGTQGDGRFLMDKNPAGVISTGTIVGSAAAQFAIAIFSGSSFPVSTFFQVTQQAGSQAGNMAPGTVILAIATSTAPAGYATSTTALTAGSGVACVADALSTGTIPNFETANYTVVDGTHLQLTLGKVHFAGATVAVGGLCGYGLEQTVDTVNGIRQVFPVVGSLSATQVAYAGANSAVVGSTLSSSTGGYLSTSLAITSAVRNGNVVTLTTAAGMPYDLNGLNLTVSGVADASFNGVFKVTTTGANTLTYANTGANGSSTGGNAGLTTGGFNLYPMAEVLSVLNPASGSVDGTMTLAPNTVAWSAGDALEEAHYHQQLVSADTEYVTQWVPRPSQNTAGGKQYQGNVGPGLRGWQVVNAVAASNYLGGGGTHQEPDAAYVATGPWQNTFDVEAGASTLMRVHCSLYGCNRWDSQYALYEMDSAHGLDFLFYNPVASSFTWNLQGTQYSMSPQGMYAGTITTQTVNGATLSLTGAATIGGNASIAGSATITGTATLAGGTQVTSNYGGAFISMPTGGDSGIGANLGNPWVMSIHYAGDYFPNAQPGDNAYRNTSGALLFGNSASAPSTLRIANNAVQFGTAQQANFSASGVLTAPGVIGSGAGPSFQETLYTPASSSAACTAGQFADDANFHYVCVAANTWKRVALSAF